MCTQTNSIANGRPFEISEKTDYVLIACQICIFQKIAGQRFAVELTDLVKSTRLLHPPIDSSLHGPHIYQNFHHATDSDNAEISKPPNEAKAIEHTQMWKVPQLFASHTNNIKQTTFNRKKMPSWTVDETQLC